MRGLYNTTLYGGLVFCTEAGTNAPPVPEQHGKTQKQQPKGAYDAAKPTGETRRVKNRMRARNMPGHKQCTTLWYLSARLSTVL